MKLSKESGTWLQLSALSTYTMAASVCFSIRYGFLVDSFSRKGVNGKVFGAVETSIFIGFASAYISQVIERLMKRFTSRYIFIASTVSLSIVAVITGLSYRIEDVNTFIAISFVMRIFQGFLSYTSGIVPVDYLNANFSKDFTFANGLVQMGYFTGHGVSEFLGSVLYDHFGYGVAYGFSACVALIAAFFICIVLPNNKTHLATQAVIEKEMNETDEKSYGSQALSKFLIPITVATMLCNANYGFIQVSVTPFLKKQFNKSLSYGGTALMFISLGTTIGSFSVGMLQHKKIIGHFTAMAIGAFCIFIGLLITFPSEKISLIYNQAPILAFPGVLIAGFGDPFLTVATLHALYYAQRRTNGEMQPKTSTKITGIWLISFCSMYYSGPFIGGALTDHLSYPTSAEILAGICLLSVAICFWLGFYFRGSEDGGNEERERLIESTGTY